MVELTGNSSFGVNQHGVYQHGFSNWVFIIPAGIVPLIVFFGYKLIQSMLEKEKKREEKKKSKLVKKEKHGKAQAPTASKKVK